MLFVSLCGLLSLVLFVIFYLPLSAGCLSIIRCLAIKTNVHLGTISVFLVLVKENSLAVKIFKTS